LLARIADDLFGNALRGLRFFAALSQGSVMFFTGFATRELGGKHFAQVVASPAVAVSGHAVVSGSFLSYTSFDYLWSTLVACYAC
jgi:hypothetical protein